MTYRVKLMMPRGSAPDLTFARMDLAYNFGLAAMKSGEVDGFQLLNGDGTKLSPLQAEEMYALAVERGVPLDWMPTRP